MKNIIYLILIATLFFVACDIEDTTAPGNNVDPQPMNALVINEFMSHNDAAWAGPMGDFPDWIELYNGSAETVDVGGMYVTDDLGDLELSMISDSNPELTVLAPGEFIVLIADGSPENGPLHLDLKLSDNEDFALVDTDGSTIIDQRNTGVVPDDESEGRVPDGTDVWEYLNPASPGGPN
ncbi:MAG: lamin tail domain-containing protein [Candidatus Cloacimonadota bacterium]|nr:lamin tail domain-containing protein [Candidatus Cloacimonadota bacterium]